MIINLKELSGSGDQCIIPHYLAPLFPKSLQFCCNLSDLTSENRLNSGFPHTNDFKVGISTQKRIAA